MQFKDLRDSGVLPLSIHCSWEPRWKSHPVDGDEKLYPCPDCKAVVYEMNWLLQTPSKSLALKWVKTWPFFAVVVVDGNKHNQNVLSVLDHKVSRMQSHVVLRRLVPCEVTCS